MLLIPCPWCGQRDETEFRYGGQADMSYPTDPAALDDPAWADYLFMRDNPKGWFTERWVHTYGCRRWFTVVRHTVTQEIAAVSELAPPFPTTEPSDQPVGQPSDQPVDQPVDQPAERPKVRVSSS